MLASTGAITGVFSAGAVFAPWIVVAYAIVGIGYLIASIITENLRREGFKLWLLRSSWSRTNADYWPDTEDGNKGELRALHEVLMRPTVLAQTVEGRGRDSYNPNGIWLKLVLPPDIVGHSISIHPIMVTEGSWFSADREAPYRSGMYAGYFSQGNWIGLNELAEWDSLQVRNYQHQPPAQYQASDWRIWLVHVPHSKGMDRMEIEINYPPALLQRPDNLGYRFSIDLTGIQAGTLHENPYVRGQVTEPNDTRERLVLDGIPPRSRSIFNLGVI